MRAPLTPAEPGPLPDAAGRDGLHILVVDRGGSPVAHARIQIGSARGYEERATTDEAGRTSLAVREGDPGPLGLIATRGRVAVRALDEGREASPLVHVAAPFTGEHEVQLVVGGPERRLTGRVVDGQGRPVAGALVAWYRQQERLERVLEGDFPSPSYLTATSDAEGTYTLANLPHGPCTLSCFAEGFAFASLGLDPRDASPPDFVLNHGAVVSGTVRWPDGRPAAGVSLRCEALMNSEEWATGLPCYSAEWRGFVESTTSDELGRFRLASVKSGPRVLWGQEERTGLVAQTTLLLEVDHEEHWDPDLAGARRLRVQLVDEEHRPLSGWICTCAGPRRERLVDPPARDGDDGRLCVNDCPDKTVFMDVFGPADVGASYAWRRLEPDQEETVVEIDTRAPRAPFAAGSSTPSARPWWTARSVPSRCARPEHALPGDEQGLFEQRLPPGAHLLVLNRDQTATRLARFTLAAGESLDLGTLTTPELGTLRLTTRAEGLAYSLFSLADREEEKGILQVTRGKLGAEVEIPSFPGRYRLMIFDGSGAKPREQELVVSSNEETRLEIER